MLGDSSKPLRQTVERVLRRASVAVLLCGSKSKVREQVPVQPVHFIYVASFHSITVLQRTNKPFRSIQYAVSYCTRQCWKAKRVEELWFRSPSNVQQKSFDQTISILAKKLFWESKPRKHTRRNARRYSQLLGILWTSDLELPVTSRTCRLGLSGAKGFAKNYASTKDIKWLRFLTTGADSPYFAFKFTYSCGVLQHGIFFSLSRHFFSVWSESRKSTSSGAEGMASLGLSSSWSMAEPTAFMCKVHKVQKQSTKCESKEKCENCKGFKEVKEMQRNAKKHQNAQRSCSASTVSPLSSVQHPHLAMSVFASAAQVLPLSLDS